MPEPVAVDLSEFFKYSKPKRPPCQVGYILTTLKPADQKKLEAALATDKNLITSGAVIKWFESRDITSIRGVSAITSHRNRRCTCYDE